jgi:hypothetical protein
LQQDVSRLHIAVDQPLGVGGGQAACGLHTDPQDLLDPQRFAVSQLFVQGDAGDELHHQVGDPALFVDSVDGDDVIVSHRRSGLGLTSETAASGAAGGELGRQHLDRVDPIQFRVAGLEDDAHAAPAEHLQNLEMIQPSKRAGRLRRCQERQDVFVLCVLTGFPDMINRQFRVLLTRVFDGRGRVLDRRNGHHLRRQSRHVFGDLGTGFECLGAFAHRQTRLLMGQQQRLDTPAQRGISGASLVKKGLPRGGIRLFQGAGNDALCFHELGHLPCESPVVLAARVGPPNHSAVVAESPFYYTGTRAEDSPPTEGFS